jgi:hypothetical protein
MNLFETLESYINKDMKYFIISNNELNIYGYINIIIDIELNIFCEKIPHFINSINKKYNKNFEFKLHKKQNYLKFILIN